MTLNCKLNYSPTKKLRHNSQLDKSNLHKNSENIIPILLINKLFLPFSSCIGFDSTYSLGCSFNQ